VPEINAQVERLVHELAFAGHDLVRMVSFVKAFSDLGAGI
jgi:hypothetical protein